MNKLLLSLFFLALVGITATVPPQGGGVPRVQAAAAQTLTLDVAFDGRTAIVNLVDPAIKDGARGDTFVVNGKVFLGGAIPPGGTFDTPGTFDPDASGSIGTFICRGTQLFNGAQVAAGAAPVVVTNQYFGLDNGDALLTEGLEAGVDTIRRAVTGGIGAYSGARGEALLTLIGINKTGWENYRFVFTLKN
jgi:hypothetical protein